MFSWRNKKDINIFRMKKVPYLLLFVFFVARGNLLDLYFTSLQLELSSLWQLLFFISFGIIKLILSTHHENIPI